MARAIYMLDTNICIYALTEKDGRVVEEVQTLPRGGAICSAITFAEIMVGLQGATVDEIDVVRRFFRLVPVAPFDEQAAHAYGALPFKRRATVDRMIAAHAISTDTILATNNPRDFADIPALRMEHWRR